MKLYHMFFRNVEKEYTPERHFVVKKSKTGASFKSERQEVNIADHSLLVMEDEIKKFWDYGGGIDKIVLVGELDDSLFKPVLSEPDFVEEQIKSKKNGEIIGYQG